MYLSIFSKVGYTINHLNTLLHKQQQHQ